MADTQELKKIKKIYGERFAKLCRELFPQILEEEGKLTEILKRNFATNSCSLGEDISSKPELVEEFKEYIFAQYDKEREELDENANLEKTPYEILDEAGYDLYECKTEDDIQNFGKYYNPDEVLCTIYNGGRLDSRYCFWVIKKNAEDIKREDFEAPNKSDEYSLSVLAIQFDRRTGRTEIISRYNHTVPNPNCTLENNLDKLAPGLSKSFADLFAERNLNINLESQKSFEIPGYTVANDGKYYKYNYEINGVYYCPGNIVIEGGEPTTIISPERGILTDYFYIDLENKTIEAYDKEIKDSFVDDLKSIEKIEVIRSNKQAGNRTIRIHKKEAEKDDTITIELDKDNRIVGYTNANLKNVGNNFLIWNEKLTDLKIPKLEQVGSMFLRYNRALTGLDLPELKQAGNDFLPDNEVLTELKAPKLEQVGNMFLCCNKVLKELELPELKKTGHYFLSDNEVLTELKAPKLEQVGSMFLSDNRALEKLDLPELEQVESGFLYYNNLLTELELPELKQVGHGFLDKNEILKRLKLPNLERSGNYFLYKNKALTELELPKLKYVGNYFLFDNEELTELKLPKLKEAGCNFLFSNKILKKAIVPELEQVGNNFLECNESLMNLELPSELDQMQAQKIFMLFHEYERLMNIISKNKEQITSTNIAQADVDTVLTNNDITKAESVFYKIKEKIKERKRNDKIKS